MSNLPIILTKQFIEWITKEKQINISLKNPMNSTIQRMALLEKHALDIQLQMDHVAKEVATQFNATKKTAKYSGTEMFVRELILDWTELKEWIEDQALTWERNNKGGQ